MQLGCTSCFLLAHFSWFLLLWLMCIFPQGFFIHYTYPNITGEVLSTGSFLPWSFMSDFLCRCFVRIYSLRISWSLIHDLQVSSIRLSEMACPAFLRYVKLVGLSPFVVKLIRRIFIWLFGEYRLQADTFPSYGSALVKPLSVGFALSFGS